MNCICILTSIRSQFDRGTTCSADLYPLDNYHWGWFSGIDPTWSPAEVMENQRHHCFTGSLSASHDLIADYDGMASPSDISARIKDAKHQPASHKFWLIRFPSWSEGWALYAAALIWALCVLGKRAGVPGACHSREIGSETTRTPWWWIYTFQVLLGTGSEISRPDKRDGCPKGAIIQTFSSAASVYLLFIISHGPNFFHFPVIWNPSLSSFISWSPLQPSGGRRRERKWLQYTRSVSHDTKYWFCALPEKALQTHATKWGRTTQNSSACECALVKRCHSSTLLHPSLILPTPEWIWPISIQVISCDISESTHAI